MPNLMAVLPCRIGGALCPSVQRRKVCLTPNTGVPRTRSNATKTRNPLKLAGVSQTNETISAASGPKFTTLWGHVEEILLLNKFFSDCQIRALVAKIWPDKVVRWCPDGDFLPPVFQRAACSTFQTCILNSR